MIISDYLDKKKLEDTKNYHDGKNQLKIDTRKIEQKYYLKERNYLEFNEDIIQKQKINFELQSRSNFCYFRNYQM